MTTLCTKGLMKSEEKPLGKEVPLPKSGAWGPQEAVVPVGVWFSLLEERGKMGPAAPPGLPACLGLGAGALAD